MVSDAEVTNVDRLQKAMKKPANLNKQSGNKLIIKVVRHNMG